MASWYVTDQDGDYGRTVVGLDEWHAAKQWAKATFVAREYDPRPDAVVHEREGGPALSRWQIHTEMEPMFYARLLDGDPANTPTPRDAP